MAAQNELTLGAGAWHRAVDDRDPRFDGMLFVAITTTRIYCRPVCHSRRANPDHRRFFPTASDAERAGFRACKRCRPERAPGRAACDAVARIAVEATERIEAGALNGRGVSDLAGDLGVSARHLRRALRRELGMSPIMLAQRCRIRVAARLLGDTRRPVTTIAYAAGFQSLRRFNALVREQFGVSPTILRERLAQRNQPDS